MSVLIHFTDIRNGKKDNFGLPGPRDVRNLDNYQIIGFELSEEIVNIKSKGSAQHSSVYTIMTLDSPLF